MNSLKKLKMNKVEGFLDSKEKIQKTRTSLEKKTEKALHSFTRSKQKARELAHTKYLD